MHQKRVILMQKMHFFSGKGAQPLPRVGRGTPPPHTLPPRVYKPLVNSCVVDWLNVDLLDTAERSLRAWSVGGQCPVSTSTADKWL